MKQLRFELFIAMAIVAFALCQPSHYENFDLYGDQEKLRAHLLARFPVGTKFEYLSNELGSGRYVSKKSLYLFETVETSSMTDLNSESTILVRVIDSDGEQLIQDIQARVRSLDWFP